MDELSRSGCPGPLQLYVQERNVICKSKESRFGNCAERRKTTKKSVGRKARERVWSVAFGRVSLVK